MHFQYQGADCQQYFDVINLQNYDIILGTLFLYQHQALVGLNSPRMIIGCKVPKEMKGPQVSVLESHTTEVYEESLEKAQKYLHELAQPLCLEGGMTYSGGGCRAFLCRHGEHTLGCTLAWCMCFDTCLMCK